MPSSWMDAIGPATVASLAKRHKVILNPQLVHFLNDFGDHVEAARVSQAVQVRKASKLQHDMNGAYQSALDETHAFQKAQKQSVRNQIKEVNVRKHPETYLPLIDFQLDGLPRLIFHVGKNYCAKNMIMGLGIKYADFNGALFVGRVERVVSYTKETFRKNKYNLSITEALNIWTTAALDIPLKDRVSAMEAAKNLVKERRVSRSASPDRLSDMSETPSSSQAEQSRSAIESGVLHEASDLSDASSPRHKRKRKRTVKTSRAALSTLPVSKKKKNKTASSDVDNIQPLCKASAPRRRRRKTRAYEEPQLGIPPSSNSMLRASVFEALEKKEKAAEKRKLEKERLEVMRAISAQTTSSVIVPPIVGLNSLNSGTRREDLYQPAVLSALPDSYNQFNNNLATSQGLANFVNMTTDEYLDVGKMIDGGSEASSPIAQVDLSLSKAEQVVATGGGNTDVLNGYGAHGENDSGSDNVFSFYKDDKEDQQPSPEVEEVVASGGGNMWNGVNDTNDVATNGIDNSYMINFLGYNNDEEVIASGGGNTVGEDDSEEVEFVEPTLNACDSGGAMMYTATATPAKKTAGSANGTTMRLKSRDFPGVFKRDKLDVRMVPTPKMGCAKRETRGNE